MSLKTECSFDSTQASMEEEKKEKEIAGLRKACQKREVQIVELWKKLKATQDEKNHLQQELIRKEALLVSQEVAHATEMERLLKFKEDLEKQLKEREQKSRPEKIEEINTLKEAFTRQLEDLKAAYDERLNQVTQSMEQIIHEKNEELKMEKLKVEELQKGQEKFSKHHMLSYLQSLLQSQFHEIYKYLHGKDCSDSEIINQPDLFASLFAKEAEESSVLKKTTASHQNSHTKTSAPENHIEERRSEDFSCTQIDNSVICFSVNYFSGDTTPGEDVGKRISSYADASAASCESPKVERSSDFQNAPSLDGNLGKYIKMLLTQRKGILDGQESSSFKDSYSDSGYESNQPLQDLKNTLLYSDSKRKATPVSTSYQMKTMYCEELNQIIYSSTPLTNHNENFDPKKQLPKKVAFNLDDDINQVSVVKHSDKTQERKIKQDNPVCKNPPWR